MALIPYPVLRSILIDQLRRFSTMDQGIPRRIDLGHYLNHTHIVVISGVRRAGKSTLLRQIAENFSSYLYLNLDDDRLSGMTVTDLAEVIRIFEEILPGVRVICIDEIQNVLQWERFVRRIHDEGYRIFITGSNASLLSAELGTRLTGRYVQITLWPMGFDEICRFYGVSHYPAGSQEEAEINRLFARYLEWGGFPGYLKVEDPIALQQVYEDIIYRDVISRYGIRATLVFRDLARYLFTNLTREMSYNGLAKSTLINSPMTVRSWTGYLEESYLIRSCLQFDYSLKKQHAKTRKFYGIDTGMRNMVGFRFSDDTGMLLENIVWLELIRRGHEVFWYKGKNECDLLAFQHSELALAVQVSAYLTDENRKREISGLIEAMNRFNIKKGLILTMREFQEELIDDRVIQILPVWHWILDGAKIPLFMPK